MNYGRRENNMSLKNRDEYNRWRNKTVAFRVSPEEWEQIERYVQLSGLTKQDYPAFSKTYFICNFRALTRFSALFLSFLLPRRRASASFFFLFPNPPVGRAALSPPHNILAVFLSLFVRFT